MVSHRGRRRIPFAQANLTAAERALLPNPDWITEDDADAIIAYRRRKEPAISLEEYLIKRVRLRAFAYQGVATEPRRIQ